MGIRKNLVCTLNMYYNHSTIDAGRQCLALADPSKGGVCPMFMDTQTVIAVVMLITLIILLIDKLGNKKK